MLKKSVVEHTLEAALETGADFAELYVEQTKRNHIAMVNLQCKQLFWENVVFCAFRGKVQRKGAIFGRFP